MIEVDTSGASAAVGCEIPKPSRQGLACHTTKVHDKVFLPDEVDEFSPPRPAGIQATALVNVFPVDGTTASIEIDLVKSEETLALPDVADDPEDENDGHSEHDIEEAFSISDPTTNGSNGREQLGGKDENA